MSDCDPSCIERPFVLKRHMHVVFYLSYFKTQFHCPIILQAEISHVPTKTKVAREYMKDFCLQGIANYNCFFSPF